MALALAFCVAFRGSSNSGQISQRNGPALDSLDTISGKRMKLLNNKLIEEAHSSIMSMMTCIIQET
jgi:hypothetical protein